MPGAWPGPGVRAGPDPNRSLARANAQARALGHEANDSGTEPMQELLLQLDCPVGQTTLHLSYDWNP